MSDSTHLDAAKGGRERAKKLSPDERKAIAIRAAEARWSKEGKEAIPRAIYGSPDRPASDRERHHDPLLRPR